MRSTRVFPVAAVLVVVLSACSGDPSPDRTTTTSATNRTPGATQGAEGRYESAQGIVDALNQAGFTVSEPQKNDGASYVTEVGGAGYEFTVTDSAEHAAPDSAGINMFPNAEALRVWTEISKGFGGIAVTGHTWAVSLPTGSEAARSASRRLAPKIAKVLDGTVQQ
ncbi:hypothetical protein ACFW2X_33640 [Streptomyces antibioticus]|uniref:hypothetical protein n=1 Tax=Streptomyces antibioticus TaxID=1890 RepID=UPI00367F0920